MRSSCDRDDVLSLGLNLLAGPKVTKGEEKALQLKNHGRQAGKECPPYYAQVTGFKN